MGFRIKRTKVVVEELLIYINPLLRYLVKVFRKTKSLLRNIL
jgi:hypothetical protein